MKKGAWVLMAAFVMTLMASGMAMAEEGKQGNFLCSVGSGIKNSPIGQFFTKRSEEYKARKASGK